MNSIVWSERNIYKTETNNCMKTVAVYQWTGKNRDSIPLCNIYRCYTDAI